MPAPTFFPGGFAVSFRMLSAAVSAGDVLPLLPAHADAHGLPCHRAPDAIPAPMPVGTGLFDDSGAEAKPTEDEYVSDYTGVCIGNKNSKAFHRETCSSLPSEKNRVEFADHGEAIAAGYHPCDNCKP